MMKAYFSGAVKIINDNGGEVRSFNGDGMLALFMGDTRTSRAHGAGGLARSRLLRLRS